jgi:hypothetical protein
MGLNFSYLLYFQKEQLWDTLQGLVQIAEKYSPATMIRFPDHDLEIPLEPSSMSVKEYQYNDPELAFAICLNLKEDQAIRNYLKNRDGDDGWHRSPPDTERKREVSIGYIYLTIYQKNPYSECDDTVLFEFDTTGTRMSILFSESSSIRKAFIQFLENNNGICGVFNREMGGGELFWFKDQQYSIELSDQFLLPDEIEQVLKENP